MSPPRVAQLTNPGANIASPVYAIDSASQQGITGMNAASFTDTIYADEYVTITDVGANLHLDDPGFSQNKGTDLQLYPSDGTSAQNWQVNWQADGSCNLTNQASNGLVLDDFGGGGINNDQGLYTANGGPNQEYWFVPSASSGYLIKSAYNGLFLDVHSFSPWPQVWLQASSGASTQNWQTTLASTSAGYALPGTTLTPGQYLVSPHAQCYLIQQTDGNLVLYAGSDPSHEEYHIWDFNNYDPSSSNYYTIMQTDGNLVLYQGTPSARGAAKQSSGTYVDAGAYLSVTDDGHIQIISTTGTVLWQRPQP